jgi:membrane-associated protein
VFFPLPPGSLHLPTLLAIFLTSAILGDAVNYGIGAWLGRKAFESKLIKMEYIEKTEK